MDDLYYKINELIDEINDANDKYYTTLIKECSKRNLSKTDILIYYLYADGEITQQPYRDTYKNNEEITIFKNNIILTKLCLQFKIMNDMGETYVILSKDDCVFFRNKMLDLANNI